MPNCSWRSPDSQPADWTSKISKTAGDDSQNCLHVPFNQNSTCLGCLCFKLDLCGCCTLLLFTKHSTKYMSRFSPCLISLCCWRFWFTQSISSIWVFLTPRGQSSATWKGTIIQKLPSNNSFLTRWITFAQPFILKCKWSKMGKPNNLLFERALNCQKAQSIALIIVQQKVQMDKSHAKVFLCSGSHHSSSFLCMLTWHLCSPLKQSTVSQSHSVVASFTDVSCQHKKPVFHIIIFLFTVNLVLPRSMETSDGFSFGGGWLSGGGGRG